MQERKRARAGDLLHVLLRIDFAGKVLRSDGLREIGKEAHAKARGGKGCDQFVAVADDHGFFELEDPSRRELLLQAALLDRGSKLGCASVAHGNLGAFNHDIGVGNAHGKERGEQVFRRRNAGAFATENGRPCGIDDVFCRRRNANAPKQKGEAGVGRRRAYLDATMRSGMEPDAPKTKASAQRRLHHRALLRARRQALQSLDTIEQLWQLTNHDLSAKLVAVVLGWVARNRGAVFHITPNTGFRRRSSRPSRPLCVH